MKKAYSTPEIIFENFAMSTSVAAGCEKIALNDKGEVQWGTLKIFTQTMDCRDQIIEGDDQYNKLCYHNPTDNYNVFYS